MFSYFVMVVNDGVAAATTTVFIVGVPTMSSHVWALMIASQVACAKR